MASNAGRNLPGARTPRPAAPRPGPARRCDLDHTKDCQPRGLSNHNNLAHLYPKHHDPKHPDPKHPDPKHPDPKHHTRWMVEHPGDGDPEWTSPTGHQHITEPATHITAAP